MDASQVVYIDTVALDTLENLLQGNAMARKQCNLRHVKANLRAQVTRRKLSNVLAIMSVEEEIVDEQVDLLEA